MHKILPQSYIILGTTTYDEQKMENNVRERVCRFYKNHGSSQTHIQLLPLILSPWTCLLLHLEIQGHSSDRRWVPLNIQPCRLVYICHQSHLSSIRRKDTPLFCLNLNSVSVYGPIFSPSAKTFSSRHSAASVVIFNPFCCCF